MQIEAGGGGAELWFPQVTVGSLLKEGQTGPGDVQLSGESAHIALQVPFGFIQGTSFYVGYRQSWFDGATSAESGDGIETETGTHLRARTEMDISDVTAGFSGPLNIFPSYLQGSAFIGGRYIEFDRTDKTTHATEGEDPFAIFRDISQISRMWGPQAGINVDNRPAPGGGITYGGSGSISFLAVDTSVNTRAFDSLGVFG